MESSSAVIKLREATLMIIRNQQENRYIIFPSYVGVGTLLIDWLISYMEVTIGGPQLEW